MREHSGQSEYRGAGEKMRISYARTCLLSDFIHLLMGRYVTGVILNAITYPIRWQNFGLSVVKIAKVFKTSH